MTVQCVEDGTPFPPDKLNTLCLELSNRGLTRAQAQAIASYGITNATKIAQNSTGTQFREVPDEAARARWMTQLRHIER